jgi:hypothetical protein
MGRNSTIQNLTISNYDDVERKRYFRERYQNIMKDSDRNAVKKVCQKDDTVKLFIQEYGMTNILHMYQSMLNNAKHTKKL